MRVDLHHLRASLAGSGRQGRLSAISIQPTTNHAILSLGEESGRFKDNACFTGDQMLNSVQHGEHYFSSLIVSVRADMEYLHVNDNSGTQFCPMLFSNSVDSNLMLEYAASN